LCPERAGKNVIGHDKSGRKKGLARQIFFGYDINLNQISHVPVRGKATMARSYMKEYEHE
jgi:hypothetical protein